MHILLRLDTFRHYVQICEIFGWPLPCLMEIILGLHNMTTLNIVSFYWVSNGLSSYEHFTKAVKTGSLIWHITETSPCWLGYFCKTCYITVLRTYFCFLKNNNNNNNNKKLNKMSLNKCLLHNFLVEINRNSVPIEIHSYAVTHIIVFQTTPQPHSCFLL